MSWSQSQVIDYEMRQRRKSEPVAKEKDLHEAVFDYCRSKGWIALHGSMSERTHRTPGEFDFVILADKGRHFLIECKARGGKLSPAQLAMKVHAEVLGHKPAVIYYFDEFLTAIGG